MRLVVDASVVIKWLFADPEREEHTERATTLMSAIVRQQVPVVQPVHWLAEVGAVLARMTPDKAEEDIALLSVLDLAVQDGAEILQRACQLAIDLNHHLFDTLYHAVALETESVLITADEHYLAKARDLGRIMHLAEWSPEE
ncbi:MAG: type II toxin-antitoxin system VapC family toxin [Pseudomonadota bacterium]